MKTNLKRLQLLLEELETDETEEENTYDSDSSIEADDVEIQGENSDTEQDMSDREIVVVTPGVRKHREMCFISKDGTKWKKHFEKCLNVELVLNFLE